MENNRKPSIRFKGFTEAWEQRELVTLGKIETGNTPSTSVSEYYSEDGLLWVTPTDIKSNITLTTEKKLSPLGIKVARVIPENSILCTCIASIGKNTFLPVKCAFNQQINALSPNDDNDPYFLFTNSYHWSENMKKAAGGLTFQIVNKTEFSSIETIIPKKPEQTKIGILFRKLDDVITLHQRKYERLTQIKKALLEKMFPSNNEDTPKIRFNGFTEAWVQRNIGEWGYFYYGHSCPKWSVTDDATIPCIRYGEMYTKFGSKIDKIYSYTNVNKNSLKFSTGNEVLVPRVGEDPMDYAHCTWLSLPNIAIGEMISVYNTNQNPLFTAMMFNATLKYEFAKRVEGGSVTNLYYEKLKEIPVSFPKKHEQEKIALFYEHIETLITLHQRKCEKLKNIKKSLLMKMFC